MITFRFRLTDESSIPLLQCCFSNKEFCDMLYNGDTVNVNKYIENNGTDLKYTCSFRYPNNTSFIDLGFANCYKKADGSYTYIGGIDPRYFNSGLGVKGDIAMLSYIFNKHPDIILTTGVFKYNIRSLKLTKSVGFNPINETETKVLYRMEKKDFYNPLVIKVLNSVTIEY